MGSPSAKAAEKATEIAALVPRDGKSNLKKDPRVDQVLEVLSLIVMNGRTKRNGERYSWTEIANDLNEEFPGLAATPRSIEVVCKRDIAPLIFVEKGHVISDLVEQGTGLNQVKEIGKLVSTTKDAFEQSIKDLNKFETGSDGRLVRTGTTASEVASLSRVLGSHLKTLQDELERFNIIPKGKSEGPSIKMDLDVNVNGIASSLANGNRAPEPTSEPVDAEFVESDP